MLTGIVSYKHVIELKLKSDKFTDAADPNDSFKSDMMFCVIFSFVIIGLILMISRNEISTVELPIKLIRSSPCIPSDSSVGTSFA